MAPLQCLLYQMLGSFIVVVVASREDPNLTLTALHSEDTELTHVQKPNSVDHETIVNKDCAGVCYVTNRRIECRDCIPKNVTSAVNEIVLSGFNESRIVPHMFYGVSWPCVVNLTILNPRANACYIKNFAFDGLTKIQTLKLGLRALQNFSYNALYGLDDLRTIDLTDCICLMVPGLTPGLSSKANAPMLHTVILTRVGVAFDGIQLTQDFVDILAHRKVSDLDISFNTIGFASPQIDLSGFCQCVENLNLADSSLVYLKLDQRPACDSFRWIDISGVTFPGSKKIEGNITIDPGFYPLFEFGADWIKAFRSVSIFYANYIIPTKHYIFFNNVTVYLKVNNSLTEIHLSGYSLPVLEMTIRIDPNHLKYLDISNNKIERLGADLLIHLEHLKTIDLSNNRLAVSKQLENAFSKLFRNNSKLEIVRLSTNGLNYLPSKVFQFNSELKRIDLSNNKILQVPFEVSHLHKLELLDLRRNSIEYLNEWSRHQLDMLYRRKQEARNTEDTSFTVDLRGNIFSCKCHSLDFIKWFVHSPIFEDSRGLYHCELDSKHIPMDTGAINRAEFDCDKPQREARRLVLIILLPCVSTGILVGIAILILKRYKRDKLYRRLREQIDLIHENQLGYRFPVFLSYASEDSAFVEINIRRPLEVSILDHKPVILYYKS